jgi:hypothetical protein
MKKIHILVVAALIAAGGLAQAAGKPERNVSAGRHPNLAAAQRLSREAYQKVEAAQRANEFDLGGHAAKAKQLLEQANDELKAAAETSNQKK